MIELGRGREQKSDYSSFSLPHFFSCRDENRKGNGGKKRKGINTKMENREKEGKEKGEGRRREGEEMKGE